MATATGPASRSGGARVGATGGGVGEAGRRWLPRFVALSLVWGMSFVFIKVADEVLAPLQVSAGRVFFGMAALAVVMVVRRERPPASVRLWAHLAVAGFVLNVVPFTLFALAEQRIPSVVAGLCNATTPLFTAVVAWMALRGERLGRGGVAGVGLGFCGVVVVLGVWRGVGGASGVGTAMALGAALCYGVGWVYLRRFVTGSGHSSLSLAFSQLLAASVELAVVVPAATSAPAGLSWRVVGSVAALGVLGTGLAYLWQYDLIRIGGPQVASTVTYCVPLVSTVAGAVLLAEPTGWNQPVGGVLVVAGAYLTQRRVRR